MVEGLAILKKKLKKTGSLWLNVGDTYYGSGMGSQKGDIEPSGKQVYVLPYEAKTNSRNIQSNWLTPKQLMLMPSRLAIALQGGGWILRNDCIWHKPNPMPSSVKDRLNTTFEHIFHFVKSRRYYYDLDAIREPHKEQSFERANRGNSGYDKSMQDKMVGYHHDFKPHGVFDKRALNLAGKNPGDVIYAVDECTISDKNNDFVYKEGNIHSNEAQHDKDLVIAFKGNPPTNWNRLGEHDNGENLGDFWQITTQPFPEAHFATFPVKLCEKPIKATLPKEICVNCGFIREKITKVDYEWQTKSKTIGDKQSLRQEEFGTYIIPGHATATHSIIGWTNCKCPDKVPECQSCSSLDYPYHDICCDTGIISDWKNIDKWKAGVILDPFAGAGTTFVAMYEYNPTAKFIGFELNQKYIDIAMKRLEPYLSQTRISEFMEI